MEKLKLDSSFVAGLNAAIKDGYSSVGKGDWIDEGKFQWREVIVQREQDGKYFRFTETRTGDHWSGYEREEGLLEGEEVQPVERVSTAWVRVE